MVYERIDVAQPEVVGEDESCTYVVVFVDFCYCVRVPVFTFYLYKCGRTKARHAFSLTL